MTRQETKWCFTAPETSSNMFSAGYGCLKNSPPRQHQNSENLTVPFFLWYQKCCKFAAIGHLVENKTHKVQATRVLSECGKVTSTYIGSRERGSFSKAQTCIHVCKISTVSVTFIFAEWRSFCQCVLHAWRRVGYIFHFLNDKSMLLVTLFFCHVYTYT